MSGGHTSAAPERGYLPGTSPVHRLPPQVKLVALVAFLLTVVATPREQYWAFAAHLLLLTAVAALAHVPARHVVRRLAVEVPFVLFALALPFVATGPRVDVLGLSLSEDGLLGAWNILAKATLGVVASILLAATTPLRELLRGMARLHAPALFVQIATFLLRYLDVVAGDLHRMRIAREARGFVAGEAGRVRSLRVLAASAGALFLRSYERGERVHLAMLSRGYAGTLPVLDEAPARRGDWARAALLPAAGLAIALAALARTWEAG